PDLLSREPRRRDARDPREVHERPLHLAELVVDGGERRPDRSVRRHRSPSATSRPTPAASAFSKTTAAAATSSRAVPVESKTVISPGERRPGLFPPTTSASSACTAS